MKLASAKLGQCVQIFFLILLAELFKMSALIAFVDPVDHLFLKDSTTHDPVDFFQHFIRGLSV